jgi:hypothetical protein
MPDFWLTTAEVKLSNGARLVVDLELNLDGGEGKDGILES